MKLATATALLTLIPAAAWASVMPDCDEPTPAWMDAPLEEFIRHGPQVAFLGVARDAQRSMRDQEREARERRDSGGWTERELEQMRRDHEREVERERRLGRELDDVWDRIERDRREQRRRHWSNRMFSDPNFGASGRGRAKRDFRDRHIGGDNSRCGGCGRGRDHTSRDSTGNNRD